MDAKQGVQVDSPSGGNTGKLKSKYSRFVDYLKETQQSGFTGYIKINFSQGQIGRIEKFEEILKNQS